MATICEPQADNEIEAITGVELANDPALKAPRSWQELMPHGISWPVVFWLGVVHFGALLAFAPKFFYWQSVGLMLFLHWLTGGIGVCLGYHRQFTHRSFQTFKPIRYFLALVGGLAGEGSCLNWVCTHRRHHAYSDDHGDPHSPQDGAWWSHMIWTFGRADSDELNAFYQRWIPDLVNNRVLRVLDQMFILNHVLLAGLLYMIGTAFGGSNLGCSFVVWGVFVRLVFVMHSTWLVNSASHMWGYRNYETTDDSRNNWWVAVVTYGEGWHNNHHAYPTMARHGHKWWEVDVTFATIRLMQMCGLAWNVVDHKHKKRTQDATVKLAAQGSVESILQAHRTPETDSQRPVTSGNDGVSKG